MKEATKSPAGGKVSFRTVLQLGGKTATGFVVPDEIVTRLGAGKRPPVKVTIKGYTYRNTIAVMGGEFMIGVSAEHRGKAGVAAGETLEVSLELDTEPRIVDVPADFRKTLDADAAAKRHFESLSYSNKRRIVLQIDDAKTAETRQRRIDKALAGLREAGK